MYFQASLLYLHALYERPQEALLVLVGGTIEATVDLAAVPMHGFMLPLLSLSVRGSHLGGGELRGEVFGYAVQVGTLLLVHRLR
jgi:hypothetical protein